MRQMNRQTNIYSIFGDKLSLVKQACIEKQYIVTIWLILLHKNLLFWNHLLSQCIVLCGIHLVLSIAILFIIITSNISNEWNVIVTTVMINIFNFFLCELNVKP